MADHHHNNSIGLAFLLNLGFALLEVVGGLFFNSIVVLSDALHDMGDSLALGIAWIFEKVSHKEQDHDFTYGYRRYALLGAIINAIIIISGSVIIIVHAIERLFQPVKPVVPGMIGFAILGILVNGVAVWRLQPERSFNAKMVTWHLLEDVLGWAAVLFVSVLILFTDWYFLDPLAALIITALVLYNVIKNLRKVLAVLLQKVPDDISNSDVIAHLSHLPKVRNVHHTHLWSLDGERHVLTTHIVVEENTSQSEILHIKEQVRLLARTLQCEHVTVEIERWDSECTMYSESNI